MKKSLITAAIAAREHAYAPYSRFAVGAAVEMDDGSVFIGCNVENISYGLTICAERAAIASAVAAGKRKLSSIAICAESNEPVTPCGACRQVMAEFAASEVEIVSVNLKGDKFSATLEQLLPRAKAGILG